MVKDFKAIIADFKEKGEKNKGKISAIVLSVLLPLGGFGLGVRAQGQWAQKDAQVDAVAGNVASENVVSNNEISEKLQNVTNRLAEVLQESGVEKEQIKTLTERVGKCTTKEEMESAMKTMQAKLEEMLQNSIDDKIAEMQNAQQVSETQQPLQESDAQEMRKQLIIKLDLLIEDITKMENDLKSGIRTDYNAMFVEAKSIVGMFERNADIAGSKRLEYVNKLSDAICRYIVAMELDNGINNVRKETGIVEFSATREGEGSQYIAINEKGKQLINARSNYLIIAEGGTETATNGKVVEESSVLQYQQKLYDVDGHIKETVGGGTFEDERYTEISFEVLGGYTVSSGGVRLPDAPESYTIKLDKEGKLAEIVVVDEGKPTTIEFDSLSQEAFNSNLNQAKTEIGKVAENQIGAVQQ